MRERKKFKSKRLIIISLIIIALLTLSSLIIYQYNQYNQVEKRLNTAYSSVNFQSSTLYRLFSTYSEADYLLRMYSISFNDNLFLEYSQKIDTIKLVIDSLAALPIENNPIKQNEQKDHNLALEYLTLKKQVDNLVLYTKDTVPTILKEKQELVNKNTKLNLLNTDSVVSRILRDSTLKNILNDTIVKKKEGFFKRVFQSKDDTIVNRNEQNLHNYELINVVLKNNIQELVTNNNREFNNNIKQLKNTFQQLKTKESELLLSNFRLLNNLKNGIEKLRQLEYESNKKIQHKDFIVYKQNTTNLRTQLIFALSLMLFMVFLVISYQNQVFSFEKKLIKEKDYADKVAEEKTSVLANISHEIRTPLNSLKGLISILQNNNSSNKIDKEIINSIDHDITVITSTINDILSLSKLESESLKIKNENINIYNLIEDLINLHTFQAESKKLNFYNNNTIDKNIIIFSNPFRIKQIMSNLITNAIKYTNYGEVTVTSSIENNSLLIVKVEDTGIGIDKEESNLIFRKYYVTNNKSKVGGFGLGLYISKILSEQMGGKISLESTLGKGTIFTFELPIINIEENHINNPQSYKISDIPENLNIIIIDDSRINLFFIQQIFKERKNTHTFIDAEQALNYIHNNTVDIVVTDIKMPKVTGWDILKAIKSNSKFDNVKVFASTAEPLLLEYNKENYHFDGIINKPIKEHEIVYKIIISQS